jgi:hypothetical protein
MWGDGRPPINTRADVVYTRLSRNSDCRLQIQKGLNNGTLFPALGCVPERMYNGSENNLYQEPSGVGSGIAIAVEAMKADCDTDAGPDSRIC